MAPALTGEYRRAFKPALAAPAPLTRLLVLGLLLLAGCAAKAPPPAPPSPQVVDDADMVLASPAFEDGGDIPREHTCDAAGTSPPLAVADAPPAATHLALVVIDPDVPFPPPLAQRTIDHWLVWDVPLENGTVGFPADGVPPGAVEWTEGWRPPCPPAGSPAHGYVFTAYALDGPLGLARDATRADVERALEGRVLAEATMIGRYARQPV